MCDARIGVASATVDDRQRRNEFAQAFAAIAEKPMPPRV
jgi:hypothetical protein